MNKVLTRILIKILTSISKLSWKNIYRLSDFFRFLIFDLVGYRKAVILTNLRNSFPDQKEQSIQHIAHKFYRNFTDIIFETIKLNSISRSDLLNRIEFDSTLLDYYYACKRNLVVVAGHLGNWEMLNLFASARLSHHIVVVYHELENTTFDQWFKNVRSRFGSEMVPMQEAFAKAIQPREKPYIFILINDQSAAPEKAYWSRFLNQDTGVFRGVELIARRMNAPVLYMGVLKNELKRGFYKFYFDLITETPKQEPNNQILETQLNLLERDIRIQPDNWLWSHKRWKHRRPATLHPFQLLEETKKCE